MTHTAHDRSTDAVSPEPIRIQSPADIVDLVPYLLGFHPTDSLVLVGIGGGSVAVTARIDLPDIDHPTLTDVFLAFARHGRCTQTIAVIYADSGDDADGLARLVEQVSDTADIQVLDHVLVSAGRWRSLACTNPDCCPADGTPLQPEGAVAAAAVYAGLVAQPCRTAALATLDRPTPVAPDTLVPLIAAAEEEAAHAVLAGGGTRHERSIVPAAFKAVRAGQRLADPTAAQLLVGLSSAAVRDPLWLATDAGRIDGTDLWLDLAHRAPTGYAAPVWFLVAWGTWRQGNSILAREAAERALAGDPNYTAARLLLTAIDTGVNPHTMPKLRTATTGTAG